MVLGLHMYPHKKDTVTRQEHQKPTDNMYGKTRWQGILKNPEGQAGGDPLPTAIDQQAIPICVAESRRKPGAFDGPESRRP